MAKATVTGLKGKNTTEYETFDVYYDPIVKLNHCYINLGNQSKWWRWHRGQYSCHVFASKYFKSSILALYYFWNIIHSFNDRQNNN